MSAATDRTTAVGIVVVHYEAPRPLDLVLGALESTSVPVRVIVADDGSAVPPSPGDRSFPVDVVTQPDLGFRAAAARNLGARVLLEAEPALGALLFLDGDTIPAPGYVTRMLDQLEHLAESAPRRRALVVGRRRYADLDGLSRSEALEFVAEPARAPARILPDTAWLDDGYAQTDLLRAADDRSYRYVISAVLGLTRELWEAVGGFDESFVGYGGEDWDLANRAWLAGADLRHVPEAVAWHDGPDAAGRAGQDDTGYDHQDTGGAARRSRLGPKDAESRRLADVVTDPGARDPGLLWEYPDIVVEVDDRGWAAADTLLTCADLLRGTDARIWLAEGHVLRDGTWPRTDPRVTTGPVPERVRERARFRIEVGRPLRLTGPLGLLCDDAPLAAPGLTIARTRDLARGDVRPDTTGAGVRGTTAHPSLRAPRDGTSLEAEWGWLTPDDLPPLMPDPPAPPDTGTPSPSPDRGGRR